VHSPELEIVMSLRTLGLFAALACFLPAQSPKDDDEIAKEGPVDPFTKGEEKAMQALGVVAYGPLPWADGLRTTDIEKVLGENRILWLETAHFRIGCNLGSTGAPSDAEARKLLNGELKRLNKKWSKVPSRGSKVSPWVRLHLYAQRCEELYEDYAALIGHPADATTHLGDKDKFLVLLFQKRSDLARYLDRFCAKQSNQSQRHYHGSGHHSIVISAEREDVDDAAAVHARFRFLLVQMFVDATGGMPYWLSYGLAHWYERQVPSNIINCGIREDEHVDAMAQHEWHKKVKARARRDDLYTPFRALCTSTDLGYYGHIQAWSRVDYLMQTDREKLGVFALGTKGGYSADRQEQLLDQIYGIDPETFDEQWRDWVGKNYK
jgi:hypothetical protein